MSNNRTLNILQLVNGLAIGGAELKLLELANKLKNKYPESYNQIICSIGQGGPLKEEFEKHGFETYVFSKKHKFDISLIFKVAKLMKQKKIDLVQTTLFYADIIGAFSALHAKVPIIISWETVSHAANYMHVKLHQRVMYEYAMKLVYKIVAVSLEAKNSLIEKRNINESKIEVIHYGVDVDKYIKQDNHAKKKEILIENNYPIIGIVSRLDPVKGHSYLLDAMVGVIKKYPMAKCLIVGDGSCKKELEQKAHNLGLSKNILFLGFRNDIKELLSTLDVFVLPSITEGLPNAVLEAMACDIPVVATSVGGIPEVITNKKNGILVQPKNPVPLEKAIIEVLSDDKLRKNLINNSKEIIHSTFSLEKQIQDFHKLYQKSYKVYNYNLITKDLKH